MVRDTDLLKQLIRTTIQAADFQKTRLEELLSKDFPSKHSKSFVKALIEFNNEILTILRDKETQFITLKSRDEFDNFRSYIIQYTHLMWALNYVTHIVERSTREHVNESTVLLLEHLTHKFKDAIFFVIPTHEYNYSYQNLRSILDAITIMLPRTKHLLVTLPEKLAVLSFPDIYKDNIIANSELAHEVGHFINDIDKIAKDIFSNLKLNTQKLYEYTKKDTDGLDFLEKERVKTARMKEFQHSVYRWIKELVCDLIALRLCGPAFLFALAELLLTKQYPEKVDRDYPSATFRLGLLLEEFDSIKFIDKIPDKKNKELVEELIEQIREHVNGVTELDGEPIFFEAIESVKPNIKARVDAATHGFQYEPSKFATEVFTLLEKLKEYVPPCEIKRHTPVNIISILNAGIIFRSSWRKYPPPIKIESKQNESDVIQIINSLVTKAVELSIIQQKLQGATGV